MHNEESGPTGLEFIEAASEVSGFDFTAWCEQYKDSHRSEWWTRKSGEKINEMLRDLPLTSETLQDVSEMVLYFQRAHNANAARLMISRTGSAANATWPAVSIITV